MPRTRSLAWAELKIGLMSIFALVMATVAHLPAERRTASSGSAIRSRPSSPTSPGLKEGAPVRVAGVEVGSVDGVEFVGDRVEVLMEVLQGESAADHDDVGRDARVGVAARRGRRGHHRVERRHADSRVGLRAVAARQRIAGRRRRPGERGIEELTALMKDIRAGTGHAWPAVHRRVAVSRADRPGRRRPRRWRNNINQGRGTLGRLTNDPAAARALEGSLENLEAMTARIRAGEGSLGKLLTDDALATSLTSATGEPRRDHRPDQRGEGTLGKLATDQELYNRLNSMTDRLDKVVARAAAGRGHRRPAAPRQAVV